MKTLSVQQPWASLICAGIKDVENRTWKAAQVPGRILIHASSKKVTKNFFSKIPEEMESYISNDVFFGNLPALETLPTSAIIGYVTVTGFEEGEMDSVWADPAGVIKWKLEDAWLFDEPILNVNGKLNLFDYDGIDENNLPPAHQIDIADVDINDAEDEVSVPCNKEAFEQLKNDKIYDLSIYLTTYLQPILCEKDSLKMKPFKTATFFCGDEYVKYELKKETGVYNIPDLDDETKPYMIQYHAGFEGGWMEVVFVLGKQLDKGETVEICGGVKYELGKGLEKMMSKHENVSLCGGIQVDITKDFEKMMKKEMKKFEDKNTIEFKVNKDTFKEIVTGKKVSFTNEITPKNLSKFFLLNEKGAVKEIKGIPQLRRYDAIKFINKENSYICQINNADVTYYDAEYGSYKPYTELEEEEKVDFTDCVIVYALGEMIK